MIKLVFFGSFLNYSVQVLAALVADPQISVETVITTPPQPAGRAKKLTKTPVHLWAEKHRLRVLTPSRLDSASLTQLGSKPDLLVTAGYGKLLPKAWLKYPQLGALNLHFSLLPAYRGANPAEWAILMAEKTTGVSVIEMGQEFDTGRVIAQAKLPISAQNTRETLYQKLYSLGSQILPYVVVKYAQYQDSTRFPANSTADNSSIENLSIAFPPVAQPANSPTPTATRFSRDQGQVAWPLVHAAIQAQASSLEGLSKLLLMAARHQQLKPIQLPAFLARACRALSGFPGLWTVVPTNKGQKRMKILKCRVENGRLILEKVQIAGQQPAAWNQVKNILE